MTNKVKVSNNKKKISEKKVEVSYGIGCYFRGRYVEVEFGREDTVAHESVVGSGTRRRRRHRCCSVKIFWRS